MGSFVGHIGPAFAYISVAIWWCYNLSILTHSNKPWQGSTWFPHRRHRRAELLWWFITLLVAFLIEQTQATRPFVFHDRGHMNQVATLAHTALYFMYFGYALLAYITDGLRCGTPARRLLEGLVPQIFCLVFAMSGFIFYGHSRGHCILEQVLHQLIYLTYFGLAIIIALENFNRGSKLWLFWRVVATLQLGIWFGITGIVLYKTNWRQQNIARAVDDDHDAALADPNVMFLPTLYAFVLVANVTCVIISLSFRRRPPTQDYVELNSLGTSSVLEEAPSSTL